MDLYMERWAGTDVYGYMRVVSKIPLLTKQEEQDLATIAANGRQQAQKLAEVTQHFGSLEAVPRKWQAQVDASLRAVEAGYEAERRLVHYNLRWAAYVARHSMGFNQESSLEVVRYATPSTGSRRRVERLRQFAHDALPLEDRIQAANIGLIEASYRYHPGVGASFIGYANDYIANEVLRAVRDERYRGFLSRSIAESMTHVLAARQKLMRLTQKEPGLRELAADVGMGVMAVERRLAESPTIPTTTIESVDAYCLEYDPATGERLSVADLVPADDSRAPVQLTGSSQADPAETVAINQARTVLDKVLSTLSEREAGVVSMRYGLYDGEPKTLDEIGKHYGVTRERVRQIEAKAMSKLRHGSRSDVLRGILNEGDAGDFEAYHAGVQREQGLRRQGREMAHAQDLAPFRRHPAGSGHMPTQGSAADRSSETHPAR